MEDSQTKPPVKMSSPSVDTVPLFDGNTSPSARKAHSGKWGVREVVTAVLMSVLTILLMFTGSTFTLVNNNLAMVLSGGAAVLLAAPVFMLMVQRVDRLGTATVFTTLCSLIFCVIGNFVYMIPFYIVGGVLIDALFLRKESQRGNLWFVTAAWTAFSGGYLLSTLIPMLLDLQGYLQESVQNRGFNQDFVDSFLYFYTNPVWVITIMLVTMACGFVGCLIGRAIIRRHFSRSMAK